MKILIAPDKFKGSMRASDVAARVAAGISSVAPDAEVIAVPVADGGDGTLDAALAAGFELVPVTVDGPTGEPVATGYARRGDSAVVELADACGLVRLPGGELAPLTASSTGFGQVIAAALDAGCRHLVLAIGGSASTDGGAGMLTALGARIRDAAGADVRPGGGGLEQVATVDLTGLHPALAGSAVVLASDVDNPLLGAHGAAAVYGPQKGAAPDDVARLDGALRAWSGAVAGAMGVEPGPSGHPAADGPGAGAAGGVGFAAIAVLRATARPGIELMLELTGLRDDLTGADLVVTGEGSLDEQTLHGKAPAGVAAAARRAGVPVVTVSGRNLLTDGQLTAAGVRKAYTLTDLEPDVRRCIAEPGPLLEALGRAIATDLH
ncbi:glycerate kinase [Nakamurella sp.]|uniref:glycerate kinase n=1 Tax=Nakamurella sp. TaxID=1869182 RepID=UPI003B3BD2CC